MFHEYPLLLALLQYGSAWPVPVMARLHKPRADAISSRDLFRSSMDPEIFERPDGFCRAFLVLAACFI